MLRSAVFCLIIASLGAMAGTARAITLDGATVNIDYEFPERGQFLDQSGDVVVGPGVEFSVSFGFVDVDIDGNIVTVSGASTNGFADSIFSGVVIKDIFDQVGNFLSYDIITNDFATADASFTDNELIVNLAGGGPFEPGDSIVLQYSIQAVPSPGSVILLLTAIGAFGALRCNSNTGGAMFRFKSSAT